MPKFPYPYEVSGKLVTENDLNTNLFLIKPFFNAKFDCMNMVVKTLSNKNKNAPFEKPCNTMAHNEKIKSNRNAFII